MNDGDAPLPRRVRPKAVLAALFLTALFLAAGATSARAQVTANLRLESINGGCFVNDEETLFEGDPDRYFRLGLFDAQVSSVLTACSASCIGDASPSTLDGSVLDSCAISTGCGLYDPPDLTLAKVIPNNSGAYFYIGVWDEDTDVDDSLGDHWLFTSSRLTSVAPANNNISPYYAGNPITSVCGRAVEGLGTTGNFNPRYSIWFVDASAPLAPADVRAQDDGITPFWDNDANLNFQWISASDPNTGIEGHYFDLLTSGGAPIYQAAPAPAGSSISFCPSGCQRPFSPVHGSIYLFRVGGRNGLFPGIDNATTTMSATVQIGVDLVIPTTAITAPPSGTWERAGFAVSFDDSDSGSGLDAAQCQWMVTSGGIITRTFTTRTCDGGVTATVGPAGFCRHEGVNVCRIDARSTDLARHVSTTVTRTFSVDFTTDPVPGLRAMGPGGGPLIGNGAWTPVADPLLVWDAAASAAPIAGYSHGLDTPEDCGIDTTARQVALSALTDGQHRFWVRAIDQAGNCGPPSVFILLVDTSAEEVAGLQAFVEAGGAAIEPATWQPDNDPYIAWTGPVSTSPIAGYSWALDAAPDCLPDVAVPAYEFPTDGVEDGMRLFRVRAVDAAGNCGAPVSFDLWVFRSQGISPGRIPATLVVRPDPLDAGRLELSWDPSCGVLASDYAVYEGTVGVWYSHAPIACTTGGATSISILPGGEFRYYLIVPLSVSEEGSYGMATGGTERPAAPAACLPQAPPAACP